MEMSEFEFYYTSERDHIVHCAMLWRKHFRAFEEERPNFATLIASKGYAIYIFSASVTGFFYLYY